MCICCRPVSLTTQPSKRSPPPREFQNAGLSVAADPRAVVPPDREGPPSRSSQPSATLDDHEARELREAAGLAEVVRGKLDEGLAPLADLNDLVDTATKWCDRLGSDRGGDMARHLRGLKHLVTAVNDHVMVALMELEDMSRGVFRNAPSRTDTALPEPQQEPPEHHAARSRAATASSPQCPGSTPKSALSQSASPAQPGPGNRHIR